MVPTKKLAESSTVVAVMKRSDARAVMTVANMRAEASEIINRNAVGSWVGSVMLKMAATRIAVRILNFIVVCGFRFCGLGVSD